jgi:hypothetical protein
MSTSTRLHKKLIVNLKVIYVYYTAALHILFVPLSKECNLDLSVYSMDLELRRGSDSVCVLRLARESDSE